MAHTKKAVEVVPLGYRKVAYVYPDTGEVSLRNGTQVTLFEAGDIEKIHAKLREFGIHTQQEASHEVD